MRERWREEGRTGKERNKRNIRMQGIQEYKEI